MIHTTGEGERIKAEYSVIDDGGGIIKDSESLVIVIMDPIILDAVKEVKEYLLSKIPE